MDLDLQQKHERLVQKYQEEKEKLKAFKEGFKEKKEQCDALQEQIKSLETKVRQLMEENDKLRHESQIGKKQLLAAEKQAEESKKTAWPSIDFGLLSNKDDAKQNVVLQEELNRKIEENESVHMQVFHLKQARDKVEEEMLNERKKFEAKIADLSVTVQTSEASIAKLSKERDKLEEETTADRVKREAKIEELTNMIDGANKSIFLLQQARSKLEDDMMGEINKLEEHIGALMGVIHKSNETMATWIADAARLRSEVQSSGSTSTGGGPEKEDMSAAQPGGAMNDENMAFGKLPSSGSGGVGAGDHTARGLQAQQGLSSAISSAQDRFGASVGHLFMALAPLLRGDGGDGGTSGCIGAEDGRLERTNESAMSSSSSSFDKEWRKKRAHAASAFNALCSNTAAALHSGTMIDDVLVPIIAWANEPTTTAPTNHTQRVHAVRAWERAVQRQHRLFTFYQALLWTSNAVKKEKRNEEHYLGEEEPIDSAGIVPGTGIHGIYMDKEEKNAWKRAVESLWRTHRNVNRLCARVTIAYVWMGGAHVLRPRVSGTIMASKVSISSLIKESATHLSADWTEVEEYFSSLSGASRAPIQPVLDAMQQLSTLTIYMQNDIESAINAGSRDDGTKKLTTIDTMDATAAAAAAATAPTALSNIEAVAARSKDQSLKFKHIHETSQALKLELSAQFSGLHQDLRVKKLEKRRMEEELNCIQDRFALVEANLRAANDATTPNAFTGVVRDAHTRTAWTSTSNSNAALQGRMEGGGDMSSTSGAIGDADSSSTRCEVVEELCRKTRQPSRAVHIVASDKSRREIKIEDPQTLASWSEDVRACEKELKKVYQQHLRQLETELHKSMLHVIEVNGDVEKATRKLQKYQEEKLRFMKEKARFEHANESSEKESGEMRKSYERQIQILSDHLCTLTENLETKDVFLAGVQAGEVLCTRCGSWNIIGNLFSTTVGTCSQCQGRILRN